MIARFKNRRQHKRQQFTIYTQIDLGQADYASYNSWVGDANQLHSTFTTTVTLLYHVGDT